MRESEVNETSASTVTPEAVERAREMMVKWREANDWPGLVWSAQNLSDEPRWLAAWQDLEHRIASELSSLTGEIERFSQINSQLCKDHNSLLAEISKLITQTEAARSDLARKVIQTVETTITSMRNLPADESTPEGRRDRTHLNTMAEGADEVVDALRNLFMKEGIDYDD